MNTQLCGKGELRCMATYPDGEQAIVEKEELVKYIYRVVVKPIRTGPLHLYIDHIDTI